MIYHDADDVRGELRIDSRDLIEAYGALHDRVTENEPLTPAELELYHAVAELALENIGDWEHGAYLIRTDDFEEYARELAESIGALPDSSQWPAYCIDWERAARELAMDYTTVQFLGHDYMVLA